MGSYKWVISRVTVVITHIRGLIALLITAHEPPSIHEKPAGARTASREFATPGADGRSAPFARW